MNKKAVEIVGIDTPCIDMLAHVDHVPQPNESMSMLSSSWQGGGKVATGIVAAARLGAKTAIMGAVGDDIYGKFCENDFVRHGVDTSHLYARENSMTHFSLVISDEQTEGRCIVYKSSTVVPIKFDELNLETIASAKILHLSKADETSIKAAKYASEHGVMVLFDADQYQKELDNILPYIDYLVASEFVYQHYFADENYQSNLETCLSWNKKAVVFTLGAKGCVGICDDGFFVAHAPKVQVVDTVGAGDVFHGAFAYGLTMGWAVKKICEFSSAVSSLKCTKIGGRAGIPNRQQADEFISTGKTSFEELDERERYYARGIENI